MNKYLVSFVEEDDESSVNGIYYGESIDFKDGIISIGSAFINAKDVIGVYQLISGETK